MNVQSVRMDEWLQSDVNLTLNQVFGIDNESCPTCGGSGMIAGIKAADAIGKILTHPDVKAAEPAASTQPLKINGALGVNADRGR
jgi:hypothetical protein